MNASEPSEERVERAARAMFELSPAYQDSTGVSRWTWEKLSPESKSFHRANARAALLADAPALIEAKIEGMFEATEVMKRCQWSSAGRQYADAIFDRIAVLRADLDKERAPPPVQGEGVT